MGVTANTDLNGASANAGNLCTRQQVPNTNGNWITFTVDADKKYMICHTGFDNTGAANAVKIKVVYNSTAEVDAGGAASVFSNETNSEWMNAGDVIYPKRGTGTFAMKAASGTAPMVQVRQIDRLVGGSEG